MSVNKNRDKVEDFLHLDFDELLTIIAQGGAKYCDLLVASRSIICQDEGRGN